MCLPWRVCWSTGEIPEASRNLWKSWLCSGPGESASWTDQRRPNHQEVRSRWRTQGRKIRISGTTVFSLADWCFISWLIELITHNMHCCCFREVFLCHASRLISFSGIWMLQIMRFLFFFILISVYRFPFALPKLANVTWYATTVPIESENGYCRHES